MNRKIFIKAAILELPLMLVGVLLYVSSIHSGGTSLYLSAVFVPPLYLDIIGKFPIDNFGLWVIAIACLQYPLCILYVLTFKAVFGGKVAD